MAPAGYGDKVEGFHAVAAAMSAGRVSRLFVERSRARRLSEILDAIDPSIVEFVDDVRPMADTDAPQGLVAECRSKAAVTLEALAIEHAAIMVLDHIEDPHNVGAAARSAVAAGMTGMVVSARRAAPLSSTAFKAAAGALERLPVSIVGSIPESLSRLEDLGVWVVGLDASSQQSLFGLDLLTEAVAVVVGSEGSGLAELTRKRCDLLVAIPMSSGIESLNASVSAALASFEIMRVRKRKPRTD